MLIGSLVGLVIALTIYLSQISAAKETIKRAKALGINGKINWNYEVTILLLLFYTAIGALIGTIIEAI